MYLLPAIDILGGRAVRLRQGDFEDSTVYAQDPAAAAAAWVQAGAKRLHVVDLDGARAGEPRNLDHVTRIARDAGVPVQLGGGLRSDAALEAAFAAGVWRVVLGTAALRDPDLLGRAVAAHGERVAVAVDVRGGRVSAAGWTESTDEDAETVINRLAQAGVATVIYTDVDRDGMLEGPDTAALSRIAAMTTGSLVYSGGIGTLDDLAALGEVAGLDAVIVGKALYERRFTVAEAAAALGDV